MNQHDVRSVPYVEHNVAPPCNLAVKSYMHGEYFRNITHSSGKYGFNFKYSPKCCASHTTSMQSHEHIVEYAGQNI